jgi:glycosyltransferase involved in cell wall biosynthesis
MPTRRGLLKLPLARSVNLMRILFVEPHASGHRMSVYVRALLEAARLRGWECCLLTTAAASRHPAFQIATSSMGHSLRVHIIEDIQPTLPLGVARSIEEQGRLHWRVSRSLKKLTPTWRPDFIFVVTMDCLEKALPLLGSPFGMIPFGGLFIGLRFHHAGLGLTRVTWRYARVQEYALRTIASHPMLRFVGTIDPLLIQYLRSSGFKGADKIVWIPDTCSPIVPMGRTEARQVLGIPEDEYVILCYGSLAARKGVAELVRAVADHRVPDHVTVLLAGVPSEDILAFLDGAEAKLLRHRARLIEIFRFVGGQEESQLFSAADAVWLGYKHFSSPSGVLLQSSAAGLPVIASKDGIIGYTVALHCLGECVDPQDLGSVIDCIVKLMAEDGESRYRHAGRALALQHTPSRFAQTVLDAITVSV